MEGVFRSLLFSCSFLTCQKLHLCQSINLTLLFPMKYSPVLDVFCRDWGLLSIQVLDIEAWL